MKYIDVNKLKEKIYAEDTVSLAHGSLPEFDQGCHHAFLTVLSFLDSLQQEQPDFPTTDEETEMLLATHPKVEVPNKYKTPDWLWKKLEQSEVDFEDVWKTYYDNHLFLRSPMPSKRDIARHFYELGLNARKEK